MTAPFIILISLIGALLALYGWPIEASAWVRALVALASIMMGIGAVVFFAPSPKARRLKSEHKPGPFDLLASGVAVAFLSGLIYFMLVVGPPVARQLSIELHDVVKGQTEISDANLPASNPEGSGKDEQGNNFEINTHYDPSGAVVPKSAKLTPDDEAQVSLQTFSNKSSNQLRNAHAVYLHSFSHHAFDGERWTTPRLARPKKLTPDSKGVIRLQDSKQAPDHEYTILHHRNYSSGDTIHTLQGVEFVRLAEITEVDAGTWLLPAVSNPRSRIQEYRAASSPRVFRELLARGLPIETGEAEPAYLAPSTHPALKLQVHNLAAKFSNEPLLAKRLLDLQSWLTNSFTYSPLVEYPQEGRTAIECFLENPQTSPGFCVHFASAAVLLLREMGVPSRICYGWYGGQFYEEYNEFVFRGEHAHAWAEIFLKDQGWVVFETTPALALPNSNTAPAGEAPPVAQKSDVQEEDSRFASDAAYLASAWRWMVIVLGLGLALLLALLALKRKLPARSGANRQVDGPQAPPSYLKLFHELSNALGHPRPAGRTMLQHLKQLEAKEVFIPFADELLTYHYNITYRKVPRDLRLEKQLGSQIKDFCETL